MGLPSPIFIAVLWLPQPHFQEHLGARTCILGLPHFLRIQLGCMIKNYPLVKFSYKKRNKGNSALTAAIWEKQNDMLASKYWPGMSNCNDVLCVSIHTVKSPMLCFYQLQRYKSRDQIIYFIYFCVISTHIMKS